MYFAPVEPGMDATVSYMRKLTRDVAPGQKWHYSTGETNLTGVLVERATKRDLAIYASEKIWAPYGMEQNASWMLDRTGHEQGGCCIQASTRDYARFGQFIRWRTYRWSIDRRRRQPGPRPQAGRHRPAGRLWIPVVDAGQWHVQCMASMVNRFTSIRRAAGGRDQRCVDWWNSPENRSRHAPHS